MFYSTCLLLRLAILIVPNLVHTNAYENTCVFNENSGDFSIHFNDKTFVVDINKFTNNGVEETTTTVASITTTEQTISCPLDYQHFEQSTSSCVNNKCVCPNGRQIHYTKCLEDGAELCRRCSVEGFVLVDGKCVIEGVTTSTEVSIAATTSPIDTSCQERYEHFDTSTNTCVNNKCTCPNGIPRSFKSCFIHKEENCLLNQCNSGFVYKDTYTLFFEKRPVGLCDPICENGFELIDRKCEVSPTTQATTTPPTPSCPNYQHFDHSTNACVANDCTCPNGKRYPDRYDDGPSLNYNEYNEYNDGCFIHEEENCLADQCDYGFEHKSMRKGSYGNRYWVGHCNPICEEGFKLQNRKCVCSKGPEDFSSDHCTYSDCSDKQLLVVNELVNGTCEPITCESGYVISSERPHEWNYYAERGECIPKVRLSHGHKGTIHVYDHDVNLKQNSYDGGVYQSVCNDERTINEDHPWSHLEMPFRDDPYYEFWYDNSLWTDNECYNAYNDRPGMYQYGRDPHVHRSCFNYEETDNEKVAKVVCKQLFGTEARNWKGNPGAADLYEELNLDKQHFDCEHLHGCWNYGSTTSYQGLKWHSLHCDGNEDGIESCRHEDSREDAPKCDKNADIWVDCYEE